MLSKQTAPADQTVQDQAYLLLPGARVHELLFCLRSAAGEVVLRARQAKRGDLAQTEQQRLQKLSRQVERLLSDVEAKETRLRELEQTEADQEAQKEITRLARRKGRIAKARQERSTIKQDLARLGFKMHDAIGLTAEAASLITKLARTYVAEGVQALPDLIQAVQSEADADRGRGRGAGAAHAGPAGGEDRGGHRWCRTGSPSARTIVRRRWRICARQWAPSPRACCVTSGIRSA